MRIVIIGANGQIGRHVYQQACEAFPNDEILGCVRHKHLHFEGCTGNKRQHSYVFDPFKDDWKKLGKVDVLVNCIGIIRESGELTFQKAHIGLTRLILQHRQSLGSPRIIQVSVLGADKVSPSEFMNTKAIADEELLQEEDTYIVRPSIVCTHNTMMVQKLLKLGNISRVMFNWLPFPAHILDTKIQPVLAEDVGKIIVKIAKAGSKQRIINITGPEEISLGSLLKLVNNGRIKIIPVPKKVFNALLPVIHFIAPGLLSREQLMLLASSNTASNKACSELLGRETSSTWSFWKNELQPTLIKS